MSTDTLLWVGSLAAVVAVVAPYLWLFRRERRTSRARKAEAVSLGIDRPLGQFPFIDATRCIGCGSCVDACPEGDVLAVVGGTAAVVNGLRCIGLAHCQQACPVGAIEVGLGDVKSRADIPILDPWHESSVDGVFVVGELSGMALVKNAIAQAERAIDRIAGRVSARPGRSGSSIADVAIVGAGPAGLAAAAAAQERGLSCLVVEQEGSLGGTILHYPRRKLVLLQPVDLPLWGRMKGDEYSKEHLLEIFQGLVTDHRLPIRFGERATGIERQNGEFVVQTSNAQHVARSVLLALGRRGTPRKLGVPGEERSKVMYRLQDADSYRGQKILVVGGGDSAVEAAIGLARDGRNQVTISYRRDKLLRVKKRNEDRFAALVRTGRIQTRFPSEVQEIHDRSVRLSTSAGPIEIPNDYVFVLIGGDPPFELLRKAGIRFGGEQAAAR